jgi:hypothetical protein
MTKITQKYIAPQITLYDFTIESGILEGSIGINNRVGDDEEYTRKKGWEIPWEENHSENTNFWE